MTTRVWIKVTKDELRLPMAMADTAAELAKICGTTTNAICSSVSHAKRGDLKSSSYECIEIEED